MKRFISLLLSVCMVCSFVLPVWAEAPAASGECGAGLTWEFDEETGTLTIRGTGEMEDYDNAGETPWNEYRETEKIKAVVVESGVTSIGRAAFAHCYALESISLPETLETLGELAFSNCRLVTELQLPDSLTSIGWAAFSRCMGLTEVTIPEGVTNIGDSAFWQCENLATVNFPESLEIIDGAAFEGTALVNIVIPEGVTTIGSGAFNSCTSLKSVEIPSTVTSIGNAAFYPGEDSEGNERKTSIENIVYHGPREQWKAFAEQEGGIGIGGDDATMTYEEDDVVWSYDSATGTLTIDGNDAIHDYGNTNDTPWHEYSQEVTKVVIGDGVTAIGQNSFENYPDLEAVEIGSGVTRIGNGAFGSCKSLTSITIPENVKHIGDGAFFGCEGLEEVVLEGVEMIGVSAFNGCTALETVEFPTTLQSIGDDAFFECKSLTELVLPEGVTTIGSGAFNSCTSLKSVEIPSSVEAIGNDTFFRGNGNKNTSIEEILYHGSKESWKELADNGTNIGVGWDEVTMTYEEDGVAWSFDRENGTLTIRGDGNMTDYSQKEDAPWNEYSDGIAAIVVEEGITGIGEWSFAGCANLTEVELPDSLTYIGKDVFSDCTSLEEIVIPDNVTELGESPFARCTSLAKVTLPQSLKKLGIEPFDFCENLKEIVYLGSEEEWKELMETIPGDKGLGTDVSMEELKVTYAPKPTPAPTPAPSTGGGSGDDGSAAILLAGGAAAAAAGIYLYTHPDVLPAAIEKVKEFAADVSECVQSKVQALSDGIQGMGQRWLPVADDEDEQEAQEQPAA